MNSNDKKVNTNTSVENSHSDAVQQETMQKKDDKLSDSVKKLEDANVDEENIEREEGCCGICGGH